MIIMPISTWSDFKTIVLNSKALPAQYAEYPDRYELYAAELSFIWNFALLKSSNDVTDFENNYKSGFNRPATAKSDSVPVDTSYSARFVGIQQQCSLNSTTNIDYLFSEERYFVGVSGYVANSKLGDSIDAQIIDKDNVLGFGANFVVETFVSGWFITPNSSGNDTIANQILASFKKKVPAGLYLRIKYYSVGILTTQPTLTANLLLYKKN